MASHVLIVEALFYKHITDALFSGAVSVLDKAGVTYDRIEVPGAFEIPAVVAFAHSSGRYTGYVALGCVIRGETSHYDYVAGESCRALMDLSLEGLVIGNGILTVENEAQALARCDTTKKNKGAVAAEACLAVIEARRQLRRGAAS